MATAVPTLRIAMFADTHAPKIDGVNASVSLFTRELRRRGHEVLVIAPRHPGLDPGPVDDDTILIPAIPAGFIYPQGSLGKFWHGMATGPVADAFARRPPDIIHSHTEFTIGLWMASYWRTRLGALGARRVHTFHTLYTEYMFYLPLPQALTQPFVRLLAPRVTRKRFDAVVTPSEAMRDALRRDWAITDDVARVDVVPTGVDVARLASGDGARFRARHGIEDGERVVLYLGRLAAEKNVELVIDSFAELLRRGERGLRLVVAGDGPGMTALRRRACEHGLTDVVWTGFVRGADWLDCYAAAHLLLFPSKTEAQGLVVLEALAAGVPLVSVEAMGPSSTMKGEIGCLFAAADAASFASAAQRLLEDDALHATKRREALALARASSIERRTDELVDVYRRVLNTRDAPAAFVQ